MEKSFRFLFTLIAVLMLLGSGIELIFGSSSFEKRIIKDSSHSTMVAESIVYLQKAITQFEAEHDVQNIAIRIAPIVTVTTGLLETGVSPDEPFLQSSLRFLQRFYDDQKSLGDCVMVPDDLLVKIEACLDRTFPKTESPNLSDETAFLLNALTALDDSDNSDAVNRAAEFVQKLDVDSSGEYEIIDETQHDETQYIALPGLGDSIRIRDLRRFFVDFQTLPQPNVFSDEMFDCLIASVHGLNNDPFSPDEKRFPKQESLLAALPQLYRLNDNRKKSDAEQMSSCFCETYRSFLNAFEPQQSILRKYLLADSLSALQTVRHLE